MAKPDLQPFLSRERAVHHEAAGEWPLPGAGELARERALETPGKAFVVDGFRRLTFADADGLADRLGGALEGLGVGPGDVVSWQLPSWHEGALLTIALDRIGAVSNPVLPMLREAELRFILRQARSKVLIVPGPFRGFDYRELARTVLRDAPDLEHIVVCRAEPLAGMRSFAALLDGAERPARSCSLASDAVSTIFYTSGTTAEPKGVLHTRSTLASFARVNATVTEFSAADVSLLQFPLTHIGGVGSFVVLPLLVGSTAVYLDVWTPAAAIDLIESEGATGAGGPPVILQGILSAPELRPERVRTVRVAASGAADVSPELIRELRRRFARSAFRAYGMTECPMVTSGRSGDPEEKCVTTDGRPGPGCGVRVVGDDGRPCAPGTAGEVVVFGPQLCIGYLDRALNADAFTADGWLRTGDIGVLDDSGWLTITGRKKDVILRKGETLSARAIEDVLHEHPAVAEAAVVGLPDRDRGELVCACVVVRPGTVLDLAAIDRFMASRSVMRQKIPERLEILPELPRTATGKVRKQELRDRFTKGVDNR